jgi:hypothetical protein
MNPFEPPSVPPMQTPKQPRTPAQWFLLFVVIVFFVLLFRAALDVIPVIRVR